MTNTQEIAKTSILNGEGLSYLCSLIKLEIDKKAAKTDLNAYAKKTDIVIDSALDANSTNPVQNKVLQTKFATTDTTLQNINSSLANKVDKVAGKGLSINDFTDTYKGMLDNLETNYAKKSDVSNVYKPKGTVTFDNLPAPSGAAVGDVYNIRGAFTTDANFVEGRGHDYPTGTNVVCVEDGTKLWDVLGGYFDLSPYATKTELGSYALKTDIPSPITIDGELSTTSENPVQNKVIMAYLNDHIKTRIDTTDSNITSLSTKVTRMDTDITTLFNEKAEQDDLTTLNTTVEGLKTSKQDNISAGDGIVISGNKISAKTPELIKKVISPSDDSIFKSIEYDSSTGKYVLRNYDAKAASPVDTKKAIATVDDIEAAQITVDNTLSATSENPVQNKVISIALNNKVNAINGKGLSTNDFTNDLKNKLDNLVALTDTEIQTIFNSIYATTE